MKEKLLLALIATLCLSTAGGLLWAGNCDTNCENADKDDESICDAGQLVWKYWFDGQYTCEPTFVPQDYCLTLTCDNEVKYKEYDHWEQTVPWTGWWCMVGGQLSFCGTGDSPDCSGYIQGSCAWGTANECTGAVWGDGTYVCGYTKCSGNSGCGGDCTYPLAHCSSSQECD